MVIEGKLIGMISMRDLLLYNLTQKDSEIELMRSLYSLCASFRAQRFGPLADMRVSSRLFF